jgi:PKD repeat protein
MTLYDVETSDEARLYINAYGPLNLPMTGNQLSQEFIVDVPVSSLLVGVNEFEFEYSNSSRTWGYDISALSLTIVFGQEPIDQPPTIVDIFSNIASEYRQNRISLQCYAWDLETDTQNLECDIWIRPSGGSWIVAGEPMVWSGDSHSYHWDIPDDAQLGQYDVRCVVIDSQDLQGERITDDAFQVVSDSISGPALHWADQFGTRLDNAGRGIAVDQSGNVYIVGFTSSALSDQSYFGSNDAFLRKYDKSGIEQWTRQFGSSANDYAWDVAIDPWGNVVVIGETFGALSNQTHLGGNDAFIKKIDTFGDELWTRQFGTNSYDAGNGVSIDSTGNIFIMGTTWGTFSGQAKHGSRDTYIRKYDSNGFLIWTHQFGTSESDYGLDVVSDDAGNVYTIGETRGTMSGQTSSGYADVFLVKHSANGNEVWTRQFGTASEDSGRGITIDDQNNILVTGFTLGSFSGSTNFGGYDVFVRKLDAHGYELWTQQFGTATEDYGRGITVDSSENIYIIGSTWGALLDQKHRGKNDIFVRKYSSSGLHVWTKQLGSLSEDYGWDVTSDNSSIYLTGWTQGALPGKFKGGVTDGYIVKFDQNLIHSHLRTYEPQDPLPVHVSGQYGYFALVQIDMPYAINNVIASSVTVKVFDIEWSNEGRAFINGYGPASIPISGDQHYSVYEIDFPSKWLNTGTNEVRLEYSNSTSTWGYTITQLTLTVLYESEPTLQPEANAGGPYTGVEGTTLSVNGSASIDPDGNIISYSWDFGDGHTGSGAFLNHIYEHDGTYNVTLTVEDDHGATHSHTTSAIIADTKPVAAFSVSPLQGDAPLTVTFTDASTSHDGIISWLWDFGDNATSDQQHPIYTYEHPGFYNIILRIIEADGDIHETMLVNVINVSSAYVDVTPPTALVTINIDAPDPTQTIVFSVTCIDDEQLREARLFIDDTLYQTWTTAGTQTYQAGTFTEGSHTYYVEAEDVAGNIGRDPLSGVKSFYVQTSTFEWQWLILAFILIAGMISIVVFFIRR